MIIVSDSSPLISLAILKKLNLLEQIFDRIWIPKAVYDEITMKDKPYSGELQRFSESRIKEVQNELAVRMLLNELDIGESEALVLALENNIDDILMDEYKGRRIAEAQGLSPIGTVGVLLQAKRKGFLEKVKPELDELMLHHRRISAALYNKALELAGEKSI